ncbi:unnamed protein product [Pleuronectes platessa]|uniref:Uncharacterized protein n=1 Tax=Pleuronectes platessa TaxID=8262 RepID=A0A9N7YWN5_PLEPL|nr:unnamed protein product [Pleuronectes platessa]
MLWSTGPLVHRDAECSRIPLGSRRRFLKKVPHGELVPRVQTQQATSDLLLLNDCVRRSGFFLQRTGLQVQELLTSLQQHSSHGLMGHVVPPEQRPGASGSDAQTTSTRPPPPSWF